MVSHMVPQCELSYELQYELQYELPYELLYMKITYEPSSMSYLMSLRVFLYMKKISVA